ncbi:hypothetical protein B5E84_09995 [Lachnoclostridium sp. An14]|uniref:YopX family protein n=1 Tax=Lachnoclostridium sp. An14 TaxID=1965562 RepID=UPI000B560746|nr:YopX family protein [Lachnoclostridium sp. An14]OUQ17656.1 hypothetical protein B5E84_09995 [Lachnoclostridium sp. An14]
MREILFKAKRIDNGDWVEGNYITDEQDKEKAYIGYIFGIEDFDIVEVNPETLCQYTELKDKNGNRIWENDIVRIENSMDEGIGNVEFYGGMWYVDGEPNNNLYDILEYDDGEVEVIGNIFDNPELLGKDGTE